ncbi:hypothetical protein SAMN05661008_00358 [Alkalithermobacter thermoalcaliphilus JW-YL-7 = DSM 7308]|uniref:Uncharacterized protein n=1 Tax=Alkalithermobacter thermoalcaliphilus JW-YL-7 = DSM 7308 TaxID=1121328 RepID=A0A150FPG7_CLOPD|nr:hypothetical protein JWYL7_0531 [[Clostridium] paradoxum JW-YL-7 = DSM 7308]SHK50981.1 hypothetical protein SAMN05661008_00358 [[Clostridium] paradoxum JW-YL-7 = DSM 7308]
MKHFKKRITKIVDELVIYMFYLGGTDISVNIKEEDDFFKISLKSNYSFSKKNKIEKLNTALKCSKQEEIEEYYWELAGDCDIDNELALIGMMTNEVEIDYDDHYIELTLYRYKK